jgi:metallo-beta-lactamase family protein
MSAHGDQDTDLVKGIFLVHGEYNVQKAFVSKLELKGFKSIEIPAMHQEYELGQVTTNEKVIAA